MLDTTHQTTQNSGVRRLREVTRQTPPAGWETVQALCALANVRPRTLRQWIEDGLVERPEVHSYNTFYSPKAVLQVRVIAHLRAAGQRLRVIAPKVKGASDAALKALLPAVVVEPVVPTPSAVAEDHAPEGERWVVISLMAGLQLMVRADATAFVHRAAAEIARSYRVE